jgi:hypothetical protein
VSGQLKVPAALHLRITFNLRLVCAPQNVENTNPIADRPGRDAINVLSELQRSEMAESEVS